MRRTTRSRSCGAVGSDPSRYGIRRRRCGRGFRYLDDASAVTDTETLTGIKALVIPPAWEDVWIRGLKRRRSGGDELLAYRTGRTWRDISTGDINDYLREISEG